MIKVYQSETGQYVLAHEFSHTVIIDENLERGFEKMKEHLEKNHPEMLQQVLKPFEISKGGSDGPRAWTARGLLILLPFLWLAILHYSLGSLIDQYIVKTSGEDSITAKVSQEIEPEIDALTARIDTIEQRLAPSK